MWGRCPHGWMCAYSGPDGTGNFAKSKTPGHGQPAAIACLRDGNAATGIIRWIVR
ncbi:peptidase inhibitor family I36 protein [Nonomuraea sp. CA-141351]|uniref:peptidase inhibitor family I36 protein n=1 Tax=Nonomuraea sp. CA-141351 TaxID=3239996 RepID=UPI003D90528D